MHTKIIKSEATRNICFNPVLAQPVPSPALEQTIAERNSDRYSKIKNNLVYLFGGSANIYLGLKTLLLASAWFADFGGFFWPLLSVMPLELFLFRQAKYFFSHFKDIKYNFSAQHVPLAADLRQNLAVAIPSRSSTATLLESSVLGALRAVRYHKKGKIFILDNNNPHLFKALSKAFVGEHANTLNNKCEMLSNKLYNVLRQNKYIPQLDLVKFTAYVREYTDTHSATEQPVSSVEQLYALYRKGDLRHRPDGKALRDIYATILHDCVAQMSSLALLMHEDELAQEVREFCRTYGLSEYAENRLTNEMLFIKVVARQLKDLDKYAELSVKPEGAHYTTQIIKRTVRIAYQSRCYLRAEYWSDLANGLLPQEIFTAILTHDYKIKPNLISENMYEKFTELIKRENCKTAYAELFKEAYSGGENISSSSKKLLEMFNSIWPGTAASNILLAKCLEAQLRTESSYYAANFSELAWRQYTWERSIPLREEIRMILENTLTVKKHQSLSWTQAFFDRVQQCAVADAKPEAEVVLLGLNRAQIFEAVSYAGVQTNIAWRTDEKIRLTEAIIACKNEDLRSLNYMDAYLRQYVAQTGSILTEICLNLRSIKDYCYSRLVPEELAHGLRLLTSTSNRQILKKENINLLIQYFLLTEYKFLEPHENIIKQPKQRDLHALLKANAIYNEVLLAEIVSFLTGREHLSQASLKEYLRRLKYSELDEEGIARLSQNIYCYYEDWYWVEGLKLFLIANEAVVYNSYYSPEHIELLRGTVTDIWRQIEYENNNPISERAVILHHSANSSGGKAGSINDLLSGVTLPEKMREIWSVVLQIYKTEQAGGLDVNQCPDIVTRLDREICAALTADSPYTPTDILALIYTGIVTRRPSTTLVKEILEKLSFTPQSRFAVIEHSLTEIIGEVRRRNVLYSILAEPGNIEQLRLSAGNDYATVFAIYLTGLSKQDVSTVCTALDQVKRNINQYKYADNYESQEIPRSKLDVWKELFYKPYFRAPVSVRSRTAKQIMSKYLSQLHIPNEQIWHNKLVPFGSLLKQMAESADQGEENLARIINKLAKKQAADRDYLLAIRQSPGALLSTDYAGVVVFDCGRIPNTKYLLENTYFLEKHPSLYINQTRQYYGRNLYQHPVINVADTLNSLFSNYMQKKMSAENRVFPCGSGMFLPKQNWMWGGTWQEEIVWERALNTKGQYRGKIMARVRKVPLLGYGLYKILDFLFSVSLWEFFRLKTLFYRLCRIPQAIDSIGGRLYFQIEDSISEDMTSSVRFLELGYNSNFQSGYHDKGKGPLGLLDFLGVQMFRWVKGPLAELRLFRDRNSETTFYNLLNKKQMFTAKQRQGLWFTVSGNLFAPAILLTLGLDMALFYILPKIGLVALFSNACALAIFATVGLFYLTFGMGLLQKGAYIREVGSVLSFSYMLMERITTAVYHALVRGLPGEFQITPKDGQIKKIDNSLLGRHIKHKVWIFPAMFSLTSIFGVSTSLLLGWWGVLPAALIGLSAVGMTIYAWRKFNQGASTYSLAKEKIHSTFIKRLFKSK
jgi:hypothetical protein